jgi:hypothetical protein
VQPSSRSSDAFGPTVGWPPGVSNGGLTAVNLPAALLAACPKHREDAFIYDKHTILFIPNCRKITNRIPATATGRFDPIAIL